MAQYDVAERSAIVTGGGSGIGRAVALTLAASGAAVLVTDLNEEHAKAVVAEIERYFGEGVALQPYLPKRTALQDAARRGVPVQHLGTATSRQVAAAVERLTERLAGAYAIR